MGTTIALFIFALMFVFAIFICSRLHDKLLKERAEVKNLRAEVNELKERNDWLHVVIDEATLDNQKLSQKIDAMQIDYDRLYNDYLTLQQEDEK